MEVSTMARKTQSPEEKERRAKIRELLQAANVSSMDDIQALFSAAATLFSRLGSAQISFIHLYHSTQQIALIVLLHCSADSHQKIPCAFIGQFKLSGQPFGRNAAFVCCAEEDGPEPNGEWQMCSMHYGSCCNRGLTTTVLALAGVACAEIVVFAAAAFRAYEPIRKAHFKHIFPTGCFCCKPCTKILE